LGLDGVRLLFAAITAYWVYCGMLLLTGGHRLLGTHSYGATWGLAVANIVHIIGISHVGIGISATVRVLKLEHYRSLARLAELVTLVALATAVVCIGLDVGRADRFIMVTLRHGRLQAPMIWSMTVIVVYFLASCSYLYLSMRQSFWLLSRSGPRFRWLYRFLALGYRGTPAERHRHDRTLFWLAVALVPIMVAVHSVYGLFFGLLPAKAGWYNSLQAPYFVLGAIVSGLSAILVIAGLLRLAPAWRPHLEHRAFRPVGAVLALAVFLYLYFLASEHITAQYAGPPAERAVSDGLLFGSFAIVFWLTTIIGLVVPFVYLFLQSVHREVVRIGWTTTAAALINIAMFAKRVLIVVPAQFQTHLPLPRPSVSYTPTWVEVVLVLGSYGFAALALLMLLAVVPIGGQEERPPAGDVRRSGSLVRRVALLVTSIGGLSLVTWGVVTSEQEYAPMKWLIGLVVLVAVPMLQCLIPDSGAGRKNIAGALY
jgi:molybdopterin-containing oxidoreductase family membrane subunit